MLNLRMREQSLDSNERGRWAYEIENDVERNLGYEEIIRGFHIGKQTLIARMKN